MENITTSGGSRLVPDGGVPAGRPDGETLRSAAGRATSAWDDGGSLRSGLGLPALALTNVHIPPQADLVRVSKSVGPVVRRVPSVKVARGGAVVQVKGGRGRAGPGGKRKRIETFSRASRRRLMYLLNALDRRRIPVLPIFMHLTYPALWSADYRVWKDDLEALFKRIQRQFPDCNVSIIWKLEPQKRGAPHYHLFVFGVPFIPKEWLSQAWYEIVGSDDPNHLKHGTRIERVGSWRGVMAYASKYVGKVQDETIEFSNVGRWWGIKGRKHLPVDWYSEALSIPEFFFMRRVLRRYLKRFGISPRSGRFDGASAFLPSEVTLRLLEYLAEERLE